LTEALTSVASKRWLATLALLKKLVAYRHNIRTFSTEANTAGQMPWLKLALNTWNTQYGYLDESLTIDG